MTRFSKSARFLVFFLVAGLVTGCARDPNVRKQKFLQSGQRYFEKGQYPEASIQFRNAVAADPDFAEARFRLGLTFQKLGRWHESYQELSKAVELQPSHVPSRLALAKIFLMDRQPKEAQAQIQAVQALEPNNVTAQNLLGQTYLEQNDYTQAILEFEKAQQLAPNEPLLWISCGFARVLSKQYSAAERDFRRALALDRESVEAYRNLANLYRLTGRDAMVEPLYQQALEINPRSADLHLMLADFYLQQGRVQDVESLFAKMKGRAVDFPDLRAVLGDFWTWHNEPSRAITEFQAALAEKGQKPDVLLQKKLISAYISVQKPDEAERLNQAILKQNPKDLEAHVFRAALRHLRGDSAGAVPELRAALKEQPQSPFGNFYLGLALMGSGKPMEAESAFLECVRLNENFVHAFQKLGEIRFQRGDWKAALEYARKVIALAPRSPDGYLLLAQTQLASGEPAQAERVIVQVLKKMAPDSAAVQELLAAAHIAQGKFDLGIGEYEQAWGHAQEPVGVVNRFAEALAKKGRSDLAARKVRELYVSAKNPAYLELLAHIYLGKGDWASAEAACREALSLDNSRWVAHLHLGTAYDKLGRPDEAVSQYDEVIKRQPQIVPAYVYAGDIRLRQGRLDQARAYYEQARKVQSDSPIVQHAMARLWAEQGEQLLEATSLIQGLQQKTPDDPFLSDTLAWIYYQKGMYSPARKLLKHCIEQKPDIALFHYHLGMTDLKLGEPRQSRRSLGTALRLGLNSERWTATARQALNSLKAEAN